MSFFSEKLKSHIEVIGWSKYDLAKRLEALPKDEGLSEQYVYSLLRGEKNPKPETLQKIAGLEGIGLEYKTLAAWQLVDKYGKEAIVEAFAALKETDPKRYEKLKTKAIELVKAKQK